MDLPHGLGRVFHPDDRDLKHPMLRRLAASEAAVPDVFARTPTWVGDQGPTSMCVGFAWAGFMRAQPLSVTTQPASQPETIYHEAQKIDPWEGENYDGTSVRAGGSYLKNIHDFDEYVWSFDLDHIKRWIFEHACVVVGTNWYMDMFVPTLQPFTKAHSEWVIKPGGEFAGGHAWLLYGYDNKRGFFRMVNSWGKGWGRSGRAVIRYEDMQRLLDEDGEACSAIKLRLRWRQHTS